MLSIIVPVFNVGSYLKPCLDSIIHQEYTDLEIILIDDGSTDQSGQICDEYALKDTRIVVVHQKNQGVSVARNVGLDMARGEYITFVDADDEISLDFCSNVMLFEKYPDLDLVFFTLLLFGSHELEYRYRYGTKELKLEKREDIYPCILKGDGACWGMIFKNETYFVGESNIRFPVGQTISEDMAIYSHILRHTKMLFVSTKGYYHYHIRADSAVHSEFTLEKMYYHFKTHLELYIELSEIKDFPLGYYKLRYLKYASHHLKRLPFKERNLLKVWLQDYQMLEVSFSEIMSCPNWKLRLEFLIIKTIGFIHYCTIRIWIHYLVLKFKSKSASELFERKSLTGGVP